MNVECYRKDDTVFSQGDPANSTRLGQLDERRLP
jgi:hypothetical protein